MDYTLAGIRQRVLKDKLDDTEYDTDVVDGFINDTQRDIFNQFELPFQEKIFTGTIDAGTLMFRLPVDLALSQSQTVTSPEGLQHNIKSGYLDFQTFNERFPTPANNPAGPISYWTSYGGHMLLSQPTDVEYKMTSFYIKTPAKLVQDSDVPEIPEEFEEMLILGTLERIQDRNEDADLAAVTNQKYVKQLALLVARYGFRQQGQITMRQPRRNATRRR